MISKVASFTYGGGNYVGAFTNKWRCPLTAGSNGYLGAVVCDSLCALNGAKRAERGALPVAQPGRTGDIHASVRPFGS